MFLLVSISLGGYNHKMSWISLDILIWPVSAQLHHHLPHTLTASRVGIWLLPHNMAFDLVEQIVIGHKMCCSNNMNTCKCFKTPTSKTPRHPVLVKTRVCVYWYDWFGLRILLFYRGTSRPLCCSVRTAKATPITPNNDPMAPSNWAW